MAKLRVGDTILCKIKQAIIVSPYESEFEDVRSFDIMSVDAYGYYLFVPQHIFLKNVFIVDNLHLKSLHLDKRYLGDYFIYIGEGYVYKIKAQIDGCICANCKDFIYQAEPTQSDGKFICWSCRDDLYR